MGFNNTHGWSYISTAYYNTTAPTSTRTIGTYKNDTGSSKKIVSVTLYCGTGSGNKPNSDPWGDAVNGNGKEIRASLNINGISSNAVSITNVCYKYASSDKGYISFSTSNCKAYTFTFDDGPVISNGSTASIFFNLSSSGSVLVVRTGSAYISGEVKDPYTKPSYSLNSIYPSIGIYNSTAFTMNYSITGGTNNISWVNARIYNSNGSHIKDINITNNGKGSNLRSNFKLPADVCSDGNMYKIALFFSDGKNEFETGTINIYTYRTPKINNLSINSSNFSGIGNTTLSWYTNARKWNTSPEEKPFKTYIKFGTDNSWFESSNHNDVGPDNYNNMNNKTQTLNQSIINNHFTIAQRSTSNVQTTITMRRSNISSGVNADTNAANVTVQFYPKYAPSSMTYTNPKNNSNIAPSTMLYIDEVPNVNINWTYPNTSDRGVIEGYILEIYSDEGYSKLVSKFTINSTSLAGTKTVDIKKDLKRGVLNYIKLTAFYKKPSDNTIVQSPALKQQFIIPIGKLKKPVIAYPVNNTIWHNNKFRVLFESPEDYDFDTYDTDTQNNYKYKNVEVKINNQVFSIAQNTSNMSANSIYQPNIYSTTNLLYKVKECVNPSLYANFTPSTIYKISVRYQKLYYKDIWSEWSDTVTLTINEIKNLTLIKNNNILNTEFNTMRNYSYRLWQAYPIEALPENNVIVNKGDIIYNKRHQAIFDTILNIQSGVNNWAIFDTGKENIKFNQLITELSNTNKVCQEIITADKDPRPIIQGRNYINILIDCMNKLY